ncbi:MAG: GIDE domain-containing protein [Kofleriaceae bacterium]
MNVGALMTLAAIAMGGVVVWSMLFNKTARIRRAIKRVVPTTIAQAAEGVPIRIAGVVQPGETLTAPLTGRVCVLFEMVVEEHVSNGKSGSWRQRAREVHGVPFAVVDGTGRALIDPRAAQLDVHIDTTTKSGSFDDPTPAERAVLARYQVAGQGWVFNKKLRYREGVFEVGERVTITGVAVREPDPEGVGQMAGYRGASPTRLRVGGRPDAPLMISDDVDLHR